jgi:hypothetical protein
MSNFTVTFYKVHEGLYCHEQIGLICRFGAYETGVWAADIEVPLEDLGSPLIWHMCGVDRTFWDDGSDDATYRKPPAAEVEQVEQEVRRQVGLLLLRLEKVIQQAPAKR